MLALTIDLSMNVSHMCMFFHKKTIRRMELKITMKNQMFFPDKFWTVLDENH